MLWRDGVQHPSPDGLLARCSLELADVPVCHAHLFQYLYRCAGRDKRLYSGSSSSPLLFVMRLKWLSSPEGGGFGFTRFCPTVNHGVSAAETAEPAASPEQQGWEQGVGLFSSKLAGMQAAGVLWGHGWSLWAAAVSPNLSSSPPGSHKRCWGRSACGAKQRPEALQSAL